MNIHPSELNISFNQDSNDDFAKPVACPQAETQDTVAMFTQDTVDLFADSTPDSDDSEYTITIIVDDIKIFNVEAAAEFMTGGDLVNDLDLWSE